MRTQGLKPGATGSRQMVQRPEGGAMTGAGVWGAWSGFRCSSEPKDRLPWCSTPQLQEGSSAGRTLLRTIASAQEASGLWLPVSSKLVGFAWQKRAGADSHSGTNSHSTQIRPPLPLLSALPSLLCILAAFLLVWEGRPSSPHSQDLTLPLCCPGLALTFNSVQRGCPRCPIKSPPCRPLLPSGFTRSCCTDGMA